jgi:hypothetical protein
MVSCQCINNQPRFTITASTTSLGLQPLSQLSTSLGLKSLPQLPASFYSHCLNCQPRFTVIVLNCQQRFTVTATTASCARIPITIVVSCTCRICGRLNNLKFISSKNSKVPSWPFLTEIFIIEYFVSIPLEFCARNFDKLPTLNTKWHCTITVLDE